MRDPLKTKTKKTYENHCYLNSSVKDSKLDFSSKGKYLNVTPPMNVPRMVAVSRTFAAGLVANVGNSCIYVATHVKTAAKPTKLQNEIHTEMNTNNETK